MSNKVFSAVNQQETLIHIKGSSETIRLIPHMTEELARLIALLFTDGCVSPKGVHSFRIYFVNKSERLIALFRECIVRVFGLPKKRVRIRRRSHDGYLQAVVDSKEIGHALVERFGTFRTQRWLNGEFPSARLPVKELINSGCVAKFLQVAFSCDGGVSLYPAVRTGLRGGTKWLIRSVFLACAHPKLRSDYMTLLTSLGIAAREVHGDRKIKIETKEGITRFSQTVGFVEGVEVTNHSKFWRGVTKQEVLAQLVKSYQNPREVYNLPRFQEVMR